MLSLQSFMGHWLKDLLKNLVHFWLQWNEPCLLNLGELCIAKGGSNEAAKEVFINSGLILVFILLLFLVETLVYGLASRQRQIHRSTLP